MFLRKLQSSIFQGTVVNVAVRVQNTNVVRKALRTREMCYLQVPKVLSMQNTIGTGQENVPSLLKIDND